MTAIITVVKALIVYWALYWLLKRMMVNRLNDFVILMRWIGMACFGALPIWIMKITGADNSFVFVDADHWTAVEISWGVMIPLILVFNYVMSDQPKYQNIYPALRCAQWNIGELSINALSWGVYLLAYELMFRGFLLFACVELYGVVPAVAINVGLYALAHLPKGKEETLGSIPLGILLCVVALWTQTIWAVFVLHWVLALSGDLFFIWRNPNMYFRF